MDRKDEEISEALLQLIADTFGDTITGLTGTEIIKLCNRYAVENDVKIPYSTQEELSQAGNKRTALFENLRYFDGKLQFRIINELCNMPKFKHAENLQLIKMKLYKNYGHLATEKITDTELIVETKHWLENYPAALKQYEAALSKYENGLFERNMLDDMRLALELLVKQVVGNGKSLENNISDICNLLKVEGVSPELKNMFHTIVKYYTDFHNNHTKHDDIVNENETEYIIELTSVFMKFLIKILGDRFA